MYTTISIYVPIRIFQGPAGEVTFILEVPTRIEPLEETLKNAIFCLLQYQVLRQVKHYRYM